MFIWSYWSDVPVVSQWVKAGCGSAMTASQSLLKKAFCRTRHKPRLWSNNKSTPYVHFIKHCIIELKGEELDLTGPVSCALSKIQAHNLWTEEMIMDEWKFNSVTNNQWCFCAHLCCIDFIAAHLSDIQQKQSFSSAVFILMRDKIIEERNSTVT